MYKLPHFTEDNEELIYEFMQKNSFAILTGFDGNFPVATHVPLDIKKTDNNQFVFTGHMMKNTDHHKAFLKNENVLVTFTGPHCYVSDSWYVNKDVASTWNYMDVQAKGKITFGDEEETKKKITRYNTIVKNYQEKTLQIAKEISDEYIESQKSIINSIQSAWKPYDESFRGVVNSLNSPESVVKEYSRCVSNFADNAVSAMRLTNNMIFTKLDTWKSGLEQAKDNSKHIFKQNVHAAKTFEHNSKEVRAAAAAVKDANTNVNTETTGSSTTQQQSSNKKI